MMKIAVSLVICCIIATAFGGGSDDSPSRHPPRKCRSGVWGPACSRYDPCKRGYSCINRRCCRDPVCPPRWTEGGSCNLFPGQTRCPFRYQCRKNNFCCRPPVIDPPGGTCPPLPMFMPAQDGTGPCQHWIRPSKPMCRSDRDCPRGQKCCPQLCGWRKCVKVFPWGGPIGK